MRFEWNYFRKLTLYREDRSTKSLEWAIKSAFSILGVNADVDLKRDYKGILGGGSSKQ